MIEKRTTGSAVFSVCNHILLALIGFVCFYPFLYVLMASFSEPNAFLRHNFIMLFKPAGFSLEAYKSVFTTNVAIGYRNTIFYVLAGTAISMVMTCLASYVLSQKGYLFKKPLTVMIMFTMYFNGGLIPFYLWVQKLGMIDTVWALLIPLALSTYNVIVLRTAFAAVPESLIEAARLDGANDVTCLVRVMLPLSRATLSVIILFYAVSRWNEWLPATIFLRSRTLYPLQLFLREILLTSTASSLVNNTSGVDATNATALAEIIKYATIVVSTLPVLVIYPFIQKYFVAGMMIGGVKE